jgi:ABC-2 type transport system permease protein
MITPMPAILALAANDLRLLSRRRGDLFFTFGWPLIVAIFFGLLFAGPGEGRSQIEIALADEDRTEGSQAFADRLAKDPVLSVVRVSREEAEALVRQGKRPACVILKPGFGAAVARPFFLTPQAEIGSDPARKAEAGMLEGLLARAAAMNLQAFLQDREATRKMVKEARSGLLFAPPAGDAEGLAATDRFLAELGTFLDKAPSGPGGPGGFQPIAVETRTIAAPRRGPHNSFEFSFPQGILWGIIGCAATFGVGLVAERNAGTLVRLLVAPLTRTHVLLGKALACFAAILAVEALLLTVGVAAFGVRPASGGLLVAACLAVAVAFVGLMMLISTLGQTERSASGAGWAILLVLSMLGGGMVPLFVMPAWMATASHLSPVKWAVLALEGALWRGFTAADMALPCAVLLGVGLLTFAFGARRFHTT